jgi:hypothetical protein
LHEQVTYRMRIAGATLALAALTGFAAACASAGGNANAAPKSSASDYFTCLRDNGVNLPQASRGPRGSFSPGQRPSGFPSARPSGGTDNGRGNGGGFFGSQAPPGVDQSTWNKAQKACAALRPSFGPGRDNGAFMAYRNCLADHGVTMSGSPNDLSTTDPKVAAAMQACAALRPSGRPNPAPSPSS